MVKIVDLGDEGLTVQQLLDLANVSAGVILRRGGAVIARLEPADELDLEDELWAHAPEQVARGKAARARAAGGQAIDHDEVKDFRHDGVVLW